MARQSAVATSIGVVLVNETTANDSGLPGIILDENAAAHIGAAQMDGQAIVEWPSVHYMGAAQMDGLTSPVFAGAVASGHAAMDGRASVAWTGLLSGGSHVGAARMDGVGIISFAGVGSVITAAAAQMDGAGSMLAVQAGLPLPPHGAILATGM